MQKERIMSYGPQNYDNSGIFHCTIWTNRLTFYFEILNYKYLNFQQTFIVHDIYVAVLSVCPIVGICCVKTCRQTFSLLCVLRCYHVPFIIWLPPSLVVLFRFSSQRWVLQRARQRCCTLSFVQSAPISRVQANPQCRCWQILSSHALGPAVAVIRRWVRTMLLPFMCRW